MNLKALAVLAVLLPSLAAYSQNGRIRQIFDDGWRFELAPAEKTPASNYKWEWKPVDSGTLQVQTLPADLDSGDWKDTRAGEDVFHGRRGYVWYRTTMGNGPMKPGTVLHFESIDDNGVVFLNGIRLAEHEGWDDPFDVDISKAWISAGPNILDVLVENTDGPGGVEGPVWLATPELQSETAPMAEPDFDDSSWRPVHLPHDYILEGTYDQNANNSHASLPIEPAWYRKSFTVPEDFKGKTIWLDFDGVYRDSTIYLNGHKLGTWPSGYASFRYDITGYAHVGATNVIAVHVDPRKMEGWWYEGGGIYRHVWLNAADPMHVQPWGVYVTSNVDFSAKAPAAALTIKTTAENVSTKSGSCTLVSTVYDPDGKTVASVSSDLNFEPESRVDTTQNIPNFNAQLWSLNRPKLYKVVSELKRGGNTVDQVSTTFGIRTIAFDKDRGFMLNGKSVKLKGTCNHQDFAGVGIAIPDKIFYWRIAKLKEMGSNAYRCSHNPPAQELLDACDRLGMLVMDETRHLGDATGMKSNKSTKYDNLYELKSMMLRDRNHPSIIMWSMANEEPIQGSPEGARIFKAMMDYGKTFDDTRPFSSAMNGGWLEDGISHVEDLIGINYSIDYYDKVRAAFPNKPLFASETASTVCTRGIYENERDKGYVTAYDTNHTTAEEAWEPVAKRPWMAGSFVWTGFDYKGEPSPYGWPAISSNYGIMDSCGFPKDNYYYYQAWWGNAPLVHIVPHWNWSGKEGRPVSVWVFANTPQVELFLNGKSLGVKNMPMFEHVEYSVPYEPGVLSAKAFGPGLSPIETKVETTGAPASIRLSIAWDKAPFPMSKDVADYAFDGKVIADEEDALPVKAEILDDQGRVVPTASNSIQFTVEGVGQIVGVGNGDPSDHDPDKATQRKAFNGLAMVLVGGAKTPGQIVLHATSPGLKDATITIEAKSQ